MLTAKIIGGTVLAYSDSGIPSCIDYDTFVFCHGVGYNKEIFSPLFEVVPPNLRLIAYNQRGYAGSTPLSQREQLLLLEDSESQALSYVYDLINFLKFLNRQDLPRKPIVVGWSKGTMLLIGLAAEDYLPKDVQQDVFSMMSALILYEPPGSAFALPPTKDYANAMFSGLSSQDDKLLSENFARWISGFYKSESNDPFQSSSDLLPPKLIAQASEPQMVRHGFFWRHSTVPAKQATLTASIFENGKLPIAVCFNGETAGYLIAAAEEAKKLGGIVELLDETGNHLAFAHMPKKWLMQLCGVVSGLLNRKIGQ
ncbi:hypothetical protein V1512DRAFT_293207 [Lipomyces arxii]|uniref:uncharacterized protein n=1 Tax=Lipomyces arxii TaxID=56418 RepID=UPI0034CDA8D1